MPLDVAAVRAQFPSLASGVAYFDGPGGTQTPAVVGEAIARTLTAPLSNRGIITPGERNAEAAVAGFRAAYADLLGVPADGVVYGRSATQLTYDFSRHLAKAWRPGDEIVVSQLDHDCNVRPWLQAAAASGVTVRWLPLDPASGELRLDELDALITERTRLVAVTAASNLIGTKPPVAAIAARAHAVGRWCTSTASTTPPTPTSTWPRWVRTCSSARPTSSSDRIAPCWPPTPRCWPRSPPTS